MAIADDFSIALNGDIRWTGTSGSYRVLEFHRFLQDNADNASAATADDLINITSDDPSEKSTAQILRLNPPYNITATEIEHLFDGSIVQGSGATEEKWGGLIVVGTVEDGTQPIIIQNDSLLTAYWGTAPTLLNADPAQNIVMQIMVKIREAGKDIDQRRLVVQAREFPATGGADTYAEFTVQLGDANATAAISTSSDVFSDTALATVQAYDKHDLTTGFQAIDIDPGVSPESYFQKWDITGTGTLPATPTKKSLYEYTKSVAARGTAVTIHGRNGSLHRGITHEIDYDGQGANPFVEDEFVAWGTTLAWDGSTGNFTVGEKLTFDAAGSNNGPIVATLLALQDDGTSGVMVVDVEGTAVITDNDTIDGATSGADALVDGATRLVDHNPPAVGGEGLILADDDNGASGTLYIQLVKGAAPVDNLPLHGHNRTSYLAAAAVEAAVNVTVATRTISPEFIGQYVGNYLGAFGVAVEPTDTTAADQFSPLEGGTATPPDNRTFTVSGLVAGEDYILVAKDGAPNFDTTQMTIATTALTGVTTTINVNAVPDNTPSSGTIRVIDDLGAHRRVTYTGITATSFTGCGGDNDFTAPNDAQIGNNLYVTYLDKLAGASSESFNYVFVDDTPGPLRARARDGGSTPIKTAEGTAAFSTGSITLNRISDA